MQIFTKGLFFAIFTMKAFLEAFFTLSYPNLKFHEETDFHSVRAKKVQNNKMYYPRHHLEKYHNFIIVFSVLL